RLTFGTLTLVHAHGYLAVDTGAGDLFENGRTLVRGGLQEGGEAALGQHHGAGETFEIHAGGQLHLLGDPAQLRFDDPAAVGLGYLVFRRLQGAVDTPARPALAPVAAVAAARRLEGHFGEAFPGLAGHDLVAAVGHPAQTRGAAVQRQTDGVEQGGLARAGRPGDGKDAVG